MRIVTFADIAAGYRVTEWHDGLVHDHCFSRCTRIARSISYHEAEGVAASNGSGCVDKFACGCICNGNLASVWCYYGVNGPVIKCEDGIT